MIYQVAAALEFLDFQPRRLRVAGAQQQRRKDLTPTQQVGPIPGQRLMLIQSKLVHVHGTSQNRSPIRFGIGPRPGKAGKVSGIDILNILKYT